MPSPDEHESSSVRLTLKPPKTHRTLRHVLRYGVIFGSVGLVIPTIILALGFIPNFVVAIPGWLFAICPPILLVMGFSGAASSEILLGSIVIVASSAVLYFLVGAIASALFMLVTTVLRTRR
jgi:hypothetical protein